MATLAAFIILCIIFAPIALMIWLILWVKPQESVHDVIERVVDDTIKEQAPIIARKIVEDCLKTIPYFRFVKWIQGEFQRVDKVAFNMAEQTLREHLNDEGVEFGHPDYTWDRGGAIDVAWAYEIDHWETAP